MSWLPRMAIVGTTICEPEFEAEGWTIQIFWGRIVFEFAVAMIPSGREATDA